LKYNQPFDQPSNPNASYVDGNPAAGIQGSIVPAASIEFPQREIVNALQAAGLVGTNADLTQLLQMLKIMDVFNKFKMGVNQGNASQWSCTVPTLPIMPPPTGCMIWFEPLYASVNGGTVFSVNGSSFMPVTNADLTPLTIGDVMGPGWLQLFFDGTQWEIVSGSKGRIPGVLPLLKANAYWYVNGTTGDDNNYDGTSATVGVGKIGPFKTIQRGANECPKYNMNGYNQYVNVADGNYALAVLPNTNGVGTVHLLGNSANPQNCAVSASGTQQCAIIQTSGNYDIEGFRLSTASGALDGYASNGGKAAVRNLRFGPCARYHMSSAISGSVLLDGGTITIEAGANCAGHVEASYAGLLSSNANTPPALIIQGAVAWAQGFSNAADLGIAEVFYSTITGAANATGPRYTASMNGVVDTFYHTGGQTYYPGSTPGTLTTGGQYQ
jgi:hypothetical protein